VHADPAPKVDVYMPWFCKDYMASTALFSTEEHGAYSLLLMQMWLEGGTLPLEHDRLARVARVTDPTRWAAIWQVISVKFMSAGEGRITNRKLDEVLEDARARKVAATDKGRAGAEGRWSKRNRLGIAPLAPEPAREPESAPAPPAPAPEPMHDASSGHMPEQCPSNALQSPPSKEDPDPERAHARAIPDAGAWPRPKPEPVRFNHGVVRARGQPPPPASRQMQLAPPPQPRTGTRPASKPQPAGSVYAAWVDPHPKWRPKEAWPSREPGQEG
jgi:uncharacterized protein YdaU (DUF1376 family)